MSRCNATIESRTKFSVYLCQCSKDAINNTTHKDIRDRIIERKLCNFHTRILENRIKKFDTRFGFNSELKIIKL